MTAPLARRAAAEAIGTAFLAVAVIGSGIAVQRLTPDGGLRLLTNAVLFVCVHNAGRSQMAAGYLAELSAGRIEVRSAGSLPADAVNPVAVAAMAEVGVDIAAEQPKKLSTDAVHAADVVITMGCGDTCPVFPGKRYEDWELPDPAGRSLEAVRTIRAAIRTLVEELVASLS